MRRINLAGLDLIRSFESYQEHSYKDLAGVWTIGYGHTGTEVNHGQKISLKEAEALLLTDLMRFERGVQWALDVDVTDNQFAAMVSLAFNIGVAGFQGSTVLNRLNRGKVKGAADAFSMWNKATIEGKLVTVSGLTRRRKAERKLFMKG